MPTTRWPPQKTSKPGKPKKKEKEETITGGQRCAHTYHRKKRGQKKTHVLEGVITTYQYPVIYVTDPAGNRLFQWNNQTAVNGMLSLFFKILDDPDLGLYTIQIERGSRGPVSKTFTVDEYVLPTIGTELIAPSSITILDKSVSYSFAGKYTYGLGVPGEVSGRICRKPINFFPGNACNRNPDGLCVPITGELDSNGTLSGEVDLTPFQLDRSGYSMALTMEMTLIEQGSGIQVMESKVIGITSQMGRVYFNRENMEQNFKKGLPFYIEVTAKDGGDNPLSNQTIELLVDGVFVKNLTTDANGKAKDLIDTSGMDQPTVNIQVNYKNSEQCYDSNFIVPYYTNDYISITRSYSPSGSFAQIDGPKGELQCGETHNLTVKYIFTPLGLKEGENRTHFSYMAMSRTKILNTGTVPIDLSKSPKGEFSLSVQITPEHAPGTDVIVYSMLKNEVVTSTTHLNTEKCFRNQVSLGFSKPKGKPGSTVNVNIKSASRSLCAVRLYDSSLTLLQDQPLTAAMVFSSLQFNSLNGYNIAGYNVAPPEPPCVDSNKQVLINGIYYVPVDVQNEVDTYQQLSSLGVHFITNTTVKSPTLCGRNSFIRPRPVFINSGITDMAFASNAEAFRPGEFTATIMSTDVSNTSPPEVQTSVRTTNPEVWFFDHTQTGENGSASLPLEVPGTITEWKGDMICLNSASGFGMTKYPANFTSVQEFFVSESLPYSIVRGEILTTRVIVTSTLPRCAKVRAGISSSENFTVKAMDEEKVKCICNGQRATFSFSLDAKSVGVLPISITGEAFGIGDSCDGPTDPNAPGYKDILIRSIIVEVEGIPKEVTKSTLVCVNDTKKVIPITISPPVNSVKDAVTAKVTLIGDILGAALRNPESTIREPKGCGEQTLATIMPIVLVLEYLNVTGRLTEEIKSRSVTFMEIGYQRLLRFLNSDGSFSPFGSGKSGASAWLTLWTLITMERMKPYIMIEYRIPNQALLYLEGLRDPNTGGYTPKGAVFNAALRGGDEDSVSFTAAMAAYLLQTSYKGAPTLLRDAMNFLDAASRREQSIYNMALMFYTFRVAANEDRSKAMFTKLREMQITQGGVVHWELRSQPKTPTSYLFPPQAASADIEITSYVLLALCSGPSPPLADRNYMSQIALWLSQQQRSLGSYSTTADTMVAMQALTAYGKMFYQKNASNTVEVKSGNAVLKKFNLDSKNNRDLLQTYRLPNIPGDYNMTVTGNGCVLLQTTVNFNIPVKAEDSAFRLSVSIPPESCVDGVAYTLPVSINVSYNGLRNVSNMALIDMALPSGYTPEYQSLVELRRKVPKVEEKNNHVIIYLESVSRETTTLNFTLRMNTRIQNFQMKYVYVWDYYEKELNGLAVLRHPCSKQ